MEKRLKCVLIIPYFGRIPDYFHLWLKSAEANPDFTFFLYTDLPFPVSDQSNVKLKYITFEQLQTKLRNRLGQHCKVKDPYKLCDYRPAYGYLFAEDISAFDFWGFCDIDLIFGNIGKVITQEVLKNNDKLFMHGHFCLMRNNERMNLLFKEKYPTVLDFNYTSRTNYSCHFDENGTIAYAPEFDNEIRYDFPGYFYDVPSAFYPMIYQNSEACAIWKNGTLMLYWNNAAESREIMYIHLQKRKMLSIPDSIDEQLVMLRNRFLIDDMRTPVDILIAPVNPNAQNEFVRLGNERRKKDLVKKLKTGALKFRFFRFVHHWQSR